MLPPGLDPTTLRAAFFDLDGTLLEHGEPLPGAAEAVGRLAATGVTPVIATGRMFTSARRLGRALGIGGPLVCYQGALVQDAGTGEVLASHPIEPELARELVQAVEATGNAVNVFADEAVYVAGESEHVRRYATDNEVELHAVGDLVAWLDRPVTKLVSAGDPEEMDRLRDVLDAQFADRAFIAKSLPHYLEMAAPGVSKATGMAVVAARLGLDAAECIAFGDGENDLELVAWAGYGVAVGGGFPGLVDLADWVCPPPDEAGVPRTVTAIAEAREAAVSRGTAARA